MNLADWNTLNDPDFIEAVEVLGKPKTNRLNGRHAGREIRRWNLRGAQEGQGVPPGTVDRYEDDAYMVCEWHRLNWSDATADRHYARLYFLAPIDGVYKSWWVEKLRHPVETTGTGGAGQLDARSWQYNNGEPYKDFWAVFFDGKLESPVRNREGDPSRMYRPDPGALCGIWIGGWEDSPGFNGADARTDIYPIRYPGGGEIEPPEPPVEPPDDVEAYRRGWNAALDEVVRHANSIRARE